jgi:plastocyanin
MKRRHKIIVRLVLLALAVAGLTLALGGPAAGGETATAAKAKRVKVDDNFFSPKTVRVSVGGKVTWTWAGSNPHNVTFRHVPRGASKKRASTRTSGHFTRSFGKRGKYRYVCTIHEAQGMTGTVIAG